MSRHVGAETLRYREELLAEVLDHAETEGQEAFVADAFTDLILDDLEQDGRWPDYQLVSLDRRGARVDAWGLDEDRRVLYLAVTDFDRTTTSATIPASEVTRLLARLAGFLERSRAGLIDVPDHSPIADLLDVIASRERYDSVRLYLLSGRVAPDTDIPDRELDGLQVQVRSWDLENIRRARATGARLDPIEISPEELGGGLPYLGGDGTADVSTYLLFVPAALLAAIYQEHGARLLERNVRAFLSARGKINRGIRETLKREPERFLAYNNGLTATAAKVEFDRRGDQSVITRINDLQIVNGGQTTASIAVAGRDPQVDLSNVFVQMKLVVVDETLLEEMVPNISRYANRQNAVQESDLSANHEYLRRLQEASRTEWTPAAAAGRPTKWYFERARGSYGVDHIESGPLSAQKRFLSEYPKNQRFGKNELALYENTWGRLPHLVSRGGQKNFIEFMMRLPEPPEGASEPELDAWHRELFRQLIAKAKIFKEADRIVRSNEGGTYKRAVVTYTLSYLLEHSKAQPDLSQIWRTQRIDGSFSEAISQVAGPLKEALIETAGGRNITEWAKQEACWTTLRNTEFAFEPFAAEGRSVTNDDLRRAQRPIDNKPAGSGKRLGEAIEEVHGEAIEGGFRRYRRRKWRHIGDTGVEASQGENLHAYSAPMRHGDGSEYVFNVVVDFPRREIIPIDRLDATRAGRVRSWLDSNGFPT